MEAAFGCRGLLLLLDVGRHGSLSWLQFFLVNIVLVIEILNVLLFYWNVFIMFLQLQYGNIELHKNHQLPQYSFWFSVFE